MSSAACPCDAPDETKESIRRLVLATGACAVGFAPCHDADLSRLDRWIEAGMNGSLEYMSRNRHLRLNPAGLLEGCRTVISIAFPYFHENQPRSAFFADYALGDDYHEVLRAVLAPVCDAIKAMVPGSETRICVDSAPILERQWALEAGIGFIGRNCQLIVPGIGSKVFLCEILWTASLTDEATNHDDFSWGREAPYPNCADCRACLAACPAGALSEAGVDARKCLSCLSVEHRGELDEGVVFPSRICGCDVCQDVCPYNRTAPAAVIPQFEPREEILALDAAAIAALTPETFASTFRHSTIKRLKLQNLLRNLTRRR